MLKTPEETTRTKRLKALTNEAHDKLDKRVMAAKPFASKERYCLFLNMQYHFHRDIDALYINSDLEALLPGLQSRRSLDLITQDLLDLDLPVPTLKVPPIFTKDANINEALGWLYVSEGSNQGAAFLLKFAADLGLDENFGAHHLAGHPEGRGKHWRTFTTMLDEIELTEHEEKQLVNGGVDAFNRVHALVEAIFE